MIRLELILRSGKFLKHKLMRDGRVWPFGSRFYKAAAVGTIFEMNSGELTQEQAS